MGIRRKLEKSLQVRGAWGTLLFAMRFLANKQADADPSDLAFDKAYGCDTAGVIPVSDLDVTCASWVHGNAAQSVGGSVDFANVLGPLPFEQYTFVDLGAGKGRAVLLASRLPFKKVVGVEFSKKLHAISVQNINRWREKRAPVELVHQDASYYQLPDGPLVLYLYNPFGAEIMNAVIAKVAARAEPTIVVYFTPKCAHLWDATPLKRVREAPGYIVWANFR